MHTTLRIGGLVCLSLLLAACPRPVRPPPSQPPVAPVPAADTRGAALYAVSPADSQLSILVFRGGTLARLGHNHVLTSPRLSGRVWVHPQLARSGFELALPVKDLIVDDREARLAAGAEFPPDIPPADKEGTRKNMLRAEVLDAERYPEVRLRAVRVDGTPDAPHITVRITIKDVSRDVDVPVRLVVQGARLSASGEFDIQQTSFGIKPFSVALGALEVQDRLHIKFDVVAMREADGG